MAIARLGSLSGTGLLVEFGFVLRGDDIVHVRHPAVESASASIFGKYSSTARRK